jgi:hypothetical protein
MPSNLATAAAVIPMATQPPQRLDRVPAAQTANQSVSDQFRPLSQTDPISYPFLHVPVSAPEVIKKTWGG